MGKGRIITAHGEGRYTIEILEDRARAESAKARAEARVVDLGTRISDLETEYTDAQAVVDAAATDIDQAIDDYHAEILADGTSATDIGAVTTELTVELQEAASKRDAIAGHISTLKFQRLAAQKRISLIDALPPLRQQEAWCADYTEDLSGDVATAEVPGEIGQVIVKPGFEGANQWSAAEDGAIQPALSGTPASVFYNLAMMPGWQKWRPTFRIATISNIDNDLCDITLDHATGSNQGLGVNAERGYSGVPIMYMDCNGDAFEDGDSVLVGFSGNTDKPMVVGFEKEPKECIFGVVAITAFDETSEDTLDEPSSRDIVSDGEDFYITHKEKIDRGEYAVRTIDRTSGYDDRWNYNRWNYLPSWSYPVTVGDTVTHSDYVAAYDRAVEARGGVNFKKVVIVGDRSGSSSLTIPSSVRDEIESKGAKYVIYEYEASEDENWVTIIEPYFPVD